MTPADRLVLKQCRERLANERLLLRMIKARISARVTRAEKGAVERLRRADAELIRARRACDRATRRQARARAALEVEFGHIVRSQAIADHRKAKVRQAQLDLAAARERAGL